MIVSLDIFKKMPLGNHVFNCRDKFINDSTTIFLITAVLQNIKKGPLLLGEVKGVVVGTDGETLVLILEFLALAGPEKLDNSVNDRANILIQVSSTKGS